MKRRDRERQARRVRLVRGPPLDFIGSRSGAWIVRGGDVLLAAQIVAPGTIRVIARGESRLFAIGDLAELRAVLVDGADHVLDQIRRGAIIPPDHIGPPSGEVFGEAWDRHRRAWLAENAA